MKTQLQNTSLSHQDVLQRLRLTLFVVIAFAFCLFIIEVLDRTGTIRPVPDALSRLVIYTIFLVSLYILSLGYLRWSKFSVLFIISFLLMYLLFIFDLTEELPQLADAPIIGSKSRVRGAIETFSSLGCFIAAVSGFYFAIVDLALLRLKLDEEKKRLQAVQDDLLNESVLRNSIIENAGEGLCVCHQINHPPYLYFTIWNRHMAEITGFSIEEVNRTGWHKVFFSTEKEQRLALKGLERAKRKKRLTIEEWRVMRADGEKRYFRISTTVLPINESGADSHVLTLVSDITERKDLEERYLLATKLESLGKMAGGIAHNINNLLTGICGNLYLAIDEAAPGQSRFLTNASNAASRAAELIEQLLAFCREIKLDLNPHQANESVQEVAELMRQTLDVDIQLHLHLLPDLPLVLADAAQLQSVLMNLCINSVDAIREQRETRTGGEHQTEWRILVNTHAEYRHESGAMYSVIEVVDTGAGMAPDVMGHIFEPFYTTKAESGTGLGLASAYKIIQHHNGWIECNSQPGQGATFRVYLPSVANDG